VDLDGNRIAGLAVRKQEDKLQYGRRNIRTILVPVELAELSGQIYRDAEHVVRAPTSS
jgi:hypothetical protein